MKSPDHLQHQPIISVNDYDKIDARYRGDTDAKALSIGKAQYDDSKISLKVWRYTDASWSRQSEELPLHRCIDLNILLLGALLTDLDSGYPKTSLREEVDRPEDFSKIMAFYEDNEQYLRPRLEELRDKLNKFLDK